MHEEDRNSLKKALNNLTAKVELIIQEKENDPFSQKLQNFAQELTEICGGKVTLIEKKDGFNFSGLPALTLSSDKRSNIHYLAIPEGYELQSFIQAIRFVAQGNAPIPGRTKKLLDKVSVPAKIMVFVSPSCTNCPRVVETVVSIASSNSLVSSYIIDVHYFKDLADGYRIKSVPATVIDQDLVLIGQITPEKLAEVITQRGSVHYDRERIRSLIERGLILETADLICKGEGREAILSLFEEGDLSMRMGVLVVFEEALEKDAGSIRGMVPQLIELLSREDARIRGDIADLLGKMGDPRAIPYLERLAADSDSDVVDAAAEALEVLRGS